LSRSIERGGRPKILVERAFQELQLDVELVEVGVAQVCCVVGEGDVKTIDDPRVALNRAASAAGLRSRVW